MSDLSEALEDATIYGSEQWKYDIDLILSAARSWQALVEKAKAGARIIVETLCIHGRNDLCDRPICRECAGVWGHESYCRYSGGGLRGTFTCPGGSRVDVTEKVMG